MATLDSAPAEPSRATYVRICPVCDTANAPERTRCACGALLAGIDFTLLTPAGPADALAAAPGTLAAATADDPMPDAALAPATQESAGVALPATIDAAGDAAPGPAAVPSVPIAVLSAASAGAADAASAPATIVCPHADCAQPNPADAKRCVYCNRPLHEEPVVVGARPLPAALRDRYRTIEAFRATGSEADLLLVVDRDTGAKVVAKLYRHGIEPDVRLLDVLAHAVGDTVVRILDHGVSDGVAYELLEYVPGGTLEALMRSGPLPKSDIRRIVEQIGEALRGIHAQHILHRDLKPDNVLVRATSPLALALTDFGIASFAAATQHFTSVARTTKYAAPEVLTGVLDAKSDWWSLGMIVLEAASGRHPFDGLSEQVMNHQLATRPIDVRGVFDDDLRLLCRGLLLRDPKRRFGGAEVARWLAGDATLAVGPDAEGPASSVRPYRIGKSEARTGPELALALARHWDAACRDLARGHVARWIEQELHDTNLLRTLRDVQDRRDLSDDGRLLHFLAAAAPDLPPLWRGSPVSVDAVMAAAYAAARQDAAATDWLDSLVRDDVLSSFAARHPDLRALAAAWNAAWERFAAGWERVRAAAQAQPKRSRAPDEVVNFDDLVFAFVDQSALELPPRRAQNAALLIGGVDPDFVDALRGEVTAAQGEISGYCPWFDAACEDVASDAVAVLVAHALLPQARDAATQEKRQQVATAAARARLRDDVQQALRTHVSHVLALSPKVDEDLDSQTLHGLLQAFEDVQRACTAAARLVGSDDDVARLRGWADKLASFGAQAQRALARIEATEGTNAIFLTRERIIGAAVVFGIAALLRQPIVLIVLLVAATLVVAYRWYGGFHVTEVALKRLRLFGLHARSFLRNTDPPADAVAPDGTRPGRAAAPAAPAVRTRWWRRDPSSRP